MVKYEAMVKLQTAGAVIFHKEGKLQSNEIINEAWLSNKRKQ